jgi:hypothetical protein
VQLGQVGQVGQTILCWLSAFCVGSARLFSCITTVNAEIAELAERAEIPCVLCSLCFARCSLELTS